MQLKICGLLSNREVIKGGYLLAEYSLMFLTSRLVNNRFIIWPKQRHFWQDRDIVNTD